MIGAALPSERAQSGWTEGVAIWVAVIIVSLVGRLHHTLHCISVCTDCPYGWALRCHLPSSCDVRIGTTVRLPAASGNDYQKERQFKKINSQKDSIEVAAVRSGKQIVLKNTDVLVGDVLLLNTGDKVTGTDAPLSTHVFPRRPYPTSTAESTARGSSN